ncbi:MAG: hypothetical protein ACNA8W_14700 [Bradymonadaceae bacterium]
MRPTLSRWFSIAALLALLAMPSTSAEAFTGEGHAYAGPSLANANALNGWGHWGPGAQTALVLSLSDFWRLNVGLEGSFHFESAETEDEEAIPSFAVLGAFVGVRYALDVFTYVPYVGLAVTSFLAGPRTTPEGGGFDLGAKLTIGLDYRYTRFWSFGVLADLHASFTEPTEIPVYSSINIHLARHFRW